MKVNYYPRKNFETRIKEIKLSLSSVGLVILNVWNTERQDQVGVSIINPATGKQEVKHYTI